ncbi:MAG: AAA family ATPase [Planctomycetota bacterium]
MTRGGFGLALLLDDILGFDRDAFIKMECRFRAFFPLVKSIKLLPEPAFKRAGHAKQPVPILTSSDGKGLHFELSDGTVMPAAQASDGLLLVLAYLAVLHLPEPPRLLLVEEPENGVHPKRLQEVLGILRQLVAESGETQVVMTTHSPYVLDEFEPHEVTICSKNPDGSVATRRLSESEVVQKQKDVFSLGEIWTGEGDEALSNDPQPSDDEVGEAA